MRTIRVVQCNAERPGDDPEVIYWSCTTAGDEALRQRKYRGGFGWDVEAAIEGQNDEAKPRAPYFVLQVQDEPDGDWRPLGEFNDRSGRFNAVSARSGTTTRRPS